MPNITPSEDRTVETVHVPNNPTLTGLARLTRNVAYRTGADDLVMDIIAPQSTGDDDDRHQLCQAPDGDPQARHTPAPNVLDTHGDTTYQAGKVCKVGHDIRYSEVTD